MEGTEEAEKKPFYYIQTHVEHIINLVVSRCRRRTKFLLFFFSFSSSSVSCRVVSFDGNKHGPLYWILFLLLDGWRRKIKIMYSSILMAFGMRLTHTYIHTSCAISTCFLIIDNWPAIKKNKREITSKLETFFLARRYWLVPNHSLPLCTAN